jgi:hypothetical protein
MTRFLTRTPGRQALRSVTTGPSNRSATSGTVSRQWLRENANSQNGAPVVIQEALSIPWYPRNGREAMDSLAALARNMQGILPLGVVKNAKVLLGRCLLAIKRLRRELEDYIAGCKRRAKEVAQEVQKLRAKADLLARRSWVEVETVPEGGAVRQESVLNVILPEVTEVRQFVETLIVGVREAAEEAGADPKPSSPRTRPRRIDARLNVLMRLLHCPSDEMTDAEVTDAEASDAEVADTDVIAAEATDAEVINAEVTDAEASDAEVADTDVIAAEATETEGEYAEVIYTEVIFAEVTDPTTSKGAKFEGRFDGWALLRYHPPAPRALEVVPKVKRARRIKERTQQPRSNGMPNRGYFFKGVGPRGNGKRLAAAEEVDDGVDLAALQELAETVGVGGDATWAACGEDSDTLSKWDYEIEGESHGPKPWAYLDEEQSGGETEEDSDEENSLGTSAVTGNAVKQ